MPMNAAGSFELTKEQKAKAEADRAEQRRKLELRAKVETCRRCHEAKVFERIKTVALTNPGPLESPQFWLCKPCSMLFHRFIGELHEAEREARKPFVEADLAERRAAAQKIQAEIRAKYNAEREAKGLFPLNFGSSESTAKASLGLKKPRPKRTTLDG
jgi:hypothetical protein